MKKNNHGFAPIIILVLIALAVVGYFGYKNFWPKMQSIVTPSPSTTLDTTANWKTYSDKDASFKYPENLYYFISSSNVVYFYNNKSNMERCRNDIELATTESLTDFNNSAACITELTYSAVSLISVQDYQKSIDIHTQLNGILPPFIDSQNRKWDIMNEEVEGTRLIALTKINDTYRQVYFNIGGSYTINNFIPIFHQILSTFQFTK